jgi:cAMP-dependent protein kinase regulator
MERLTHGGVRSLRSEGKIQEALFVSASMLRANPTDLTAWYLLAATLLEAGRRDEAADAFAGLSRACDKGGDLPMAVVAALQCGNAGGQAAQLLEGLAAAYSASSGGLVDDSRLSPPKVPRAVEADLRMAASREAVDGAIATGLALAESAVSAQAAAPRRFFPLWSSLGREAFACFARHLSPREAAAGEVVLAQGDAGHTFYLIARGEVRVVHRSASSETLLARLGAGSFFGEMAIVARAARAASVEAVDETILLAADMATLESLEPDAPEVGHVLRAFCHSRMLENLVLASPVLAAVPLRERPSLISRFVPRTYPAGTCVIEEGAEGPGLSLIVSGEVEVTRRDEGETLQLARLGPGDLFGEISLVLRRPATATVTTSSETVTLDLPRDVFLETIKRHPELLARLYETALEREDETASILARPVSSADDLVLV